jgi:hypothetical protein
MLEVECPAVTPEVRQDILKMYGFPPTCPRLLVQPVFGGDAVAATMEVVCLAVTREVRQAAVGTM